MTNIATINNHDLIIKEHTNQRVITFKDIDAIHERPDGTAKRNFNTNKEYFIKGEDYHEITKREFSTNFVPNSKERGNPDLTVVLITETGYLMLVKSFTDKLAWKVQRELVKSYFKTNSISQSALPTTQSTQIPSASDIALYYLTEAMKSITTAQSNAEKELSFIKEFASEQCMSFGYDVTDLKCNVKELSETINNNCGELEDEIQEIQMMTDAHAEDIQEMKNQLQYLLDWRIETIDELINNHNAIYSLNNTITNLNTDSPIINKASKIALLCDQDYRAWVNTRINDMAKIQHRWTGRIRNDTYRTLEQCGYKYLTNRCNLTQIVYGNWKNIRLAYALILLGATDELNLISA